MSTYSLFKLCIKKMNSLGQKGGRSEINQWILGVVDKLSEERSSVVIKIEECVLIMQEGQLPPDWKNRFSYRAFLDSN